MSVKIRISRIGRTHRPYFRIVVADSRCPRDGKFIQDLGTFDPIKNVMLSFDAAAYAEWQQKGAESTDSVLRLVKSYRK